MLGMIGKKIGMTQVFAEDGTLTPVTVVEAGPCTITQLKTKDIDKYSAVQLGFVEKRQKRTSKPLQGHFKKAQTTAKKKLQEFRLTEKEMEPYKLGESITLDAIFKDGDFVDVTGTSKGRGFTGVMKRHNFKGGKASHGVHEYHRHGGSIGASSFPARVIKGMKMAGQHGNAQVTVLNLKIAKADKEKNLLLIEGAVPGPNNGYLIIRKAVKKKLNIS